MFQFRIACSVWVALLLCKLQALRHDTSLCQLLSVTSSAWDLKLLRYGVLYLSYNGMVTYSYISLGRWQAALRCCCRSVAAVAGLLQLSVSPGRWQAAHTHTHTNRVCVAHTHTHKHAHIKHTHARTHTHTHTHSKERYQAAL